MFSQTTVLKSRVLGLAEVTIVEGIVIVEAIGVVVPLGGPTIQGRV